MDPAYSIPEHYPRQFSTTFGQLIQQSDSKFRSMLAPEGRWTGKQYVFRDLSKNTWQRNDTRGGDTTSRESTASFRSVFKKKIEAEAIEFPDWDTELLDSIVSPSSAEMTAMRSGYERGVDDLVIEALFEDSFGGPEPHVTSQVFPTTQIIPVNFVKPGDALGSNNGMSPWKLVRARRQLEELDIDLAREDACVALSPAEIEDLTTYVSTAPNDMWAKVVGEWLNQWQMGNMTAKLMGFTPIVTTRLAVESGIRKCAVFCRSAFVKSSAEDIKITMDRVPNRKNAMLLQGSAMLGVGRRYDEKIIQVPCYHA